MNFNFINYATNKHMFWNGKCIKLVTRADLIGNGCVVCEYLHKRVKH